MNDPQLLQAELQIRGGIEDNSKIVFYCSTKTYVMTPHKNHLDQMVLMMGHKICFYGKISTIIPKLSLLALLIWSSVQALKVAADQNDKAKTMLNLTIRALHCVYLQKRTTVTVLFLNTAVIDTT